MITIKIKIFDIEEKVDVYIIEDEDYEDFLIGLDMIEKFRLIQNADLKIEQVPKLEINKIDRNINRHIAGKIKTVSINFNEHIKIEEFKMKINHLEKKSRK